MRKLVALFVLVLLLQSQNIFAQTKTPNQVNSAGQKSLKEVLHQELKNEAYGVPAAVRPRAIDILTTYAGEKTRLTGIANPSAVQKKSIAAELQTITADTKQKLVALKLTGEQAEKLTSKVDALQLAATR